MIEIVKLKHSILLLPIILIISYEFAYSQYSGTARSIGMGPAYHGVSRGFESLYHNPAHLSLPDNPTWSISLPQAMIGYDATGLNSYKTERPNEITEIKRSDLINPFPKNGIELNEQIHGPLFALQIGRIALGASYFTVAQNTISHDALELAFNSDRDDNRTRNFDFENSGGTISNIAIFNAAYGFKVGNLRLGFTGSYILGKGLSCKKVIYSRWPSENDYDNYGYDPDSMLLEYAKTTSGKGSGFSLDVGVAYPIADRLLVSMVMKNVVGGLWWNGDIGFERDEKWSSDIIYDRFHPNFDINTPKPSSQIPEVGFDLADEMFNEARLPTTVEISMTVKPWNGANLGIAGRKNIIPGWLQGPQNDLISAGFQQQISFIQVRTGYAPGFDRGDIMSAGISLGFLHVGVARETGVKNDVVYRAERLQIGVSIRGKIKNRATPIDI